MGKLAPDAMIDGSLDYVAGSDFYCVCSGSPATFTAAYTTNVLAKTPVASGSFTKADAGGGGRQLTMTAAAGVAITASGDALAVALVNASGSTLRYVTTCTQQALVSGGTVDIPA